MIPLTGIIKARHGDVSSSGDKKSIKKFDTCNEKKGSQVVVVFSNFLIFHCK